jgi:hypothetical protein
MGKAPSPLSQAHRLSDWPECVIELHCLHCQGGSVGYPVRLLIARQGDMTFENFLRRRLRCKRCRAVKPAPVYLVTGHHRTACGGPDPDWSIELRRPRNPARPMLDLARRAASGSRIARRGPSSRGLEPCLGQSEPLRERWSPADLGDEFGLNFAREFPLRTAPVHGIAEPAAAKGPGVGRQRRRAWRERTLFMPRSIRNRAVRSSTA